MVKDTHSRQLELLLTDHCSLCEQALDLLLAEVSLRGWQLVTRDIALDDVLLNQFGEHIPVLRVEDRMLYWPFSALEVRSWLAGQ